MVKNLIVIVSQDEEWLAWVRRGLTDRGLNVATTRSASSALEFIALEKPGSVLVDARAVARPGLEFGDALHAFAGGPRVALVTASRSSWLERAASLAGIILIDSPPGAEATFGDLEDALFGPALASLHDWSRGTRGEVAWRAGKGEKDAREPGRKAA